MPKTPQAGSDRIPEGVFSAFDEPRYVAGLRQRIKIARQLQIEYPGIAQDYCRGLSMPEIIEKYDFMKHYGVKSEGILQGALGFALGGYNGSVEIIAEAAFPGLLSSENLHRASKKINQKTGSMVGSRLHVEGRGIFGISTEERRKIAATSGKQHFEKGTGMFAQTPEQQKRNRSKAIIASGGVEWGDVELSRLQELINHPDYQRKTRINAQKIATILNSEFHNGELTRTSLTVTKAVVHLKERVAKLLAKN